MISLEMIGYFSSQPQSQTYPLPGLGLIYPDRGDFIGIVGRIRDWSVTRKVKAAMLGASDLPVHSINTLAFISGVPSVLRTPAAGCVGRLGVTTTTIAFPGRVEVASLRQRT